MSVWKWIGCILCPIALVVVLWLHWWHCFQHFQQRTFSTFEPDPGHRCAQYQWWTWTAHHQMFRNNIDEIRNDFDHCKTVFATEHPDMEIVETKETNWFPAGNGVLVPREIRIRTRRR